MLMEARCEKLFEFRATMNRSLCELVGIGQVFWAEAERKAIEG
jgi:hypothetical protein